MLVALLHKMCNRRNPWTIFFRKVNCYSPDQEIIRILLYPVFHYHIRNAPHLSLCWVKYMQNHPTYKVS